MRVRDFFSAVASLAVASFCMVAALAAGGPARAAGNVVVPGTTDFPESMNASADGTLYFSSFGNGRIWRAMPGETQASEFIKSGSNGLASALGVLADDKSNTLYVCSDDFSAAGIKIPGGTATSLKLFDLKTGEPKGSIPTPGQATLCNDIVVANDGTAYVTDSFAGHILRLKRGAKEFEVWAHDSRWDVAVKPELDGLAILPDGAIYANIFEGDGLYRIPINADGSSGTITKLQTSRPLYHSDGLRAFGNKLIMVEGETKGNLDLITIDGDNAKIETIKGGFDGPVSLVQVGDQIYVLDVPLRYLLGQEAKDNRRSRSKRRRSSLRPRAEAASPTQDASGLDDLSLRSTERVAAVMSLASVGPLPAIAQEWPFPSSAAEGSKRPKAEVFTTHESGQS